MALPLHVLNPNQVARISIKIERPISVSDLDAVMPLRDKTVLPATVAGIVLMVEHLPNLIKVVLDLSALELDRSSALPGHYFYAMWHNRLALGLQRIRDLQDYSVVTANMAGTWAKRNNDGSWPKDCIEDVLFHPYFERVARLDPATVKFMDGGVHREMYGRVTRTRSPRRREVLVDKAQYRRKFQCARSRWFGMSKYVEEWADFLDGMGAQQADTKQRLRRRGLDTAGPRTY